MTVQSGRFIINQTQPVPFEALALGREAAEVAALLPRIFNLCRAAQSLAARLAMGLPTGPNVMRDLADDIARDHIFHLTLRMPQAFGLPPCRSSGPLQTDLAFSRLSSDEAGLATLKSIPVIGELLRHIDEAFHPGEAVAVLPLPDNTRMMTRGSCENSVAGRQASAPLMQHIQQTRGCGPLWRVVARLLDLSAVRAGKLPKPITAHGMAVVPASRGSYAIRVGLAEGRVTALERLTPTDHMLVPGGIAELTLASLPASKQHLADAVMTVLDPCVPVRLQREVSNA